MSQSFRRNGRRTAVCAMLGCAGLLVTGALSGTAAAAAPGVPGPAGRPALSTQVPRFSVPGRSSAKISRKAAKPQAAAGLAGSADFDGDGADDLVYKLHDGSVILDLGNNGYYTAIDAGSQIKDLLLPGDVTGDGKPDLLTLTSTGSLRLHNGANALQNEGLQPYTTVSTGWQVYNKVFAAGDLNGDGRPDLLARSTSGLFFFPGTGNASAPFGAKKQIGGTEWNQYNQLLGVGDFNGDGISDILARSAAGIRLFEGSGDPSSWKEEREIGGSGWSQYNQLVSGDYDGDGRPDLVARSYDGTLYLYEGNGNGTLSTERIVLGDGWGPVTQFAGAGDNPAFGKGGVYANTPGGTLYYYDATGTGTLTAKSYVHDGFDRSVVRLYHVSSLRGDGLSDLIGKSLYNGHLYNMADYAIDDDMLAGGSKSYNLVVGPGDLNGDGKGDLIARSSTALYYYAGNGDGLSMKGRVQVGGAGWNQYNQIVGAGDLTGDGKADIVARSSAGLFLYPGTGNASAPFGAKKQIGGAGWSQYNKLIAPGDLNGDGVADLLARTSTGLYFYAGTGTGTFRPKNLIGGAGWNQYADLS